jgi:trehalose 6-phosphate synthase/phosphatase
VAVVTATRDGMNLVPYEYVVCKQGPPGWAEPGHKSQSMLVVSGAQLHTFIKCVLLLYISSTVLCLPAASHCVSIVCVVFMTTS